MTDSSASSSPTDSPEITRLIVGMPRAATTWLCKTLNGHPDVAAFGETLFWGRRYIEPDEDGGYNDSQLEEIKRHLITGDFLESVLGEGKECLQNLTWENAGELVEEVFRGLPERPRPEVVFRALLKGVARAEGKRFGVEKTQHHLDWVDRIVKAMPEAKFVVMLREPYGFMLSYKHQGDRKPEQIRQAFRRRYHPLACAIVWRASMRAAMAAKAAHGENILWVKHEDIAESEASVMDQVLAFYQLSPVDLADSASRKSGINSSFPVERATLQAEDIFWMNLVAGGMMGAGEYEKRKTPFAPIRILWSLLRLPAWGLWNFFSMRRIVKGSLLVYLWRRINPSRQS